MTDSRFTTVAHDLDELLEELDVDDVADIETLLMVLFNRPIEVQARAEDEGQDAAIELTVWTEEGGFGPCCSYPISAIELALECASLISNLGLDEGGGPDSRDEQLDVLAMDESELVAALQEALSQVRMFNILYAKEEDQR